MSSSINKELSLDQHAYLIEGEPEQIKEGIECSLNVKLDGNPDYRESSFETLGIDEARELKEETGRRAFDGNKKIFIVKAGTLTREAQNALLKIFEEPSEGTYIFLVVTDTRSIIPTLKSRLRVIKTFGRLPADLNVAEEFLSAPPEERLQMPLIKKLLEEKEKNAIVGFLNSLELAARQKIKMEQAGELELKFFGELMKCRNYAGDRSSSVKMILEHISLAAPRLLNPR